MPVCAQIAIEQPAEILLWRPSFSMCAAAAAIARSMDTERRLLDIHSDFPSFLTLHAEPSRRRGQKTETAHIERS
jgi:hypothetical protein